MKTRAGYCQAHECVREGRGNQGDERILVVGCDSCVADSLMALRDQDKLLGVAVVDTLTEARLVLRQRRDAFKVIIARYRLPDGRGEHLLPDADTCHRHPTVVILGASLADLLLESLSYRPVALPESCDGSAILRIVRSIAGGYTRPLLRRFSGTYKLTQRETETLVYLSQGTAVKQIASRMACSEPTVYGHLRRIYERTGTKASSEVIALLLAYACQANGHTPLEYEAYRC